MEAPGTQAPHEKADPVAVWLLRQFGDKVNGLHVDRVVLAHLDVADRADLMDAWTVTARSPETALHFAEQCRYTARMDADTRGGVHRYSVQVHWPTDAGTPPRYTVFQMDGSELTRNVAGLHGATEPATSDGIVKQLMRHNEMLMRMATKQTVDIQDETRRREERLLKRIDELEHGRFRVVELTESLMSAQMERQVEADRAAAQEKRKDRALSEFVDIAGLLKPKLLQAAFKQEVVGPAPDQQMMRNMFEGMTIEQLKQMQATLPPDRQVAFIELYKHVMGLKTEKKDAGTAPKTETKSAATADADATADTTETSH